MKSLYDLHGNIGWIDAVKPFAQVYQDNQKQASLRDRRKGWMSSFGQEAVDADYWSADEPHWTDFTLLSIPLRDAVETAAVYEPHRLGLASASPHQHQEGAYYKCCLETTLQDLLRRSARRSDALRKTIVAAESGL